MRTVRALCILSSLLALALACSRAPAPGPAGRGAEQPPNLLLLTLDTLRRDHLATYGYARETMPKLDELARLCLVFERCFAPIAHTTPSHVSLLTGVYPPEHGVVANSNLKPLEEQQEQAFVPTAGLVSFAQEASARGYETAGFVSAAPLKAITGVARGFATWSEPEGARRAGGETLAEAGAWLDARPAGTPWFLWVHLFDAHGPYARGEQPPAPYDALYGEDETLRAHLAALGFPTEVRGRQVGDTTPAEAVNLYDGSLRWLDDQLAPFLERLAARADWARTALVVVGDHGQGLGQHDYLAHGVVWEEQLAVPLFLRLPGVAPRRVDALLSTVDVLPTVLAALPGLASEGFREQLRGTDALAGGPRPAVFGMSPPKRGLAALREERWKLVRDAQGAVELYDLAADPHELANVAGAHPEQVARLSAALAELESSLRERGARHAALRADGERGGEVDPKHLRELGELGYGGEGDEDER